MMTWRELRDQLNGYAEKDIRLGEMVTVCVFGEFYRAELVQSLDDDILDDGTLMIDCEDF